MSDLNSVKLFGRVAQNATFTTSDNGHKIARFTIANNRIKKVGEGEYVKEAHFFNLVVFDEYAAGLEKFLVKGQQMIVEGRLRQDRWEKNGEKHSEISIAVENIQLIFPVKKENENNKLEALGSSDKVDGNPVPVDDLSTDVMDFPPAEAVNEEFVF